MAISLTNAERALLISRLRWQRAWHRRRAEQHPAEFRALVRIDDPRGPRLGEQLQPWQRADFAALDAAWLALAGRAVEVPYRRAYLERPRGHSKTTDMAVQVAWILQWSPHAVRGLAAAADREQAQLLHAAIGDLVRKNPQLCPRLRVQQDQIRNVETGSQLLVISSDVNSSWGLLPDFVICDELCHWPRPDLWHSLCSAAAKKPSCLLAVLTNAGTGSGWTWQVREAARTSPAWYFSSLEGSLAPWITAPALDEQRRLLPPAVYARLWENRWQHSDGEFVTLAEVEACRDPSLTEQTRGVTGRHYFAAIDYAEKHDRTVGVVLHDDGARLVVDRMDVAVPTPAQPVLVSWVEDWIERIAATFGTVRFMLDEYQLLSVIQRLSQRYDIQRFDFAGGRGNHALALALRHAIVHRQIAWYPGCGAIADAATRDDLETELAALVLRSTSGGRVRIDHRREAGCHDDRAFTLGAAYLAALQAAKASDWCVVTPPSEGQIAWSEFF